MSAPHAGGGAGRKHSDSHSETRQPKASRNKLQASKSTPFKMLFFAAPRNNEIVTRKRCQFLPRSGSGSTKKRRKKTRTTYGGALSTNVPRRFSCFFFFLGGLLNLGNAYIVNFIAINLFRRGDCYTKWISRGGGLLQHNNY